MSGPKLASPLSASIEVDHPVSCSVRNSTELWRSASTSPKISPMQTIPEETADTGLDASPSSSTCASGLFDQGTQPPAPGEKIDPEIAEYVETIRAAIKRQADLPEAQKSTVLGPDDESKLEFQSKVGMKVKRSSLVVLKGKARDSLSTVKTHSKRISQLLTPLSQSRNALVETDHISRRHTDSCLLPIVDFPYSEMPQEDVESCSTDDDGEDLPLLATKTSRLSSFSDRVSEYNYHPLTDGCQARTEHGDRRARASFRKSVDFVRSPAFRRAGNARLTFQKIRHVCRRRDGWSRLDG